MDEGEGDPFPGRPQRGPAEHPRGTGEAYWFFNNTFGRDSYDDAGARMRTVNNDPRINCPNANWNGTTTNYCNGVTSDDVVAHEWGHAYTEYTYGLIYQWQSGALNESYSDIWGETVDLINGREDEDEGDLTAKRPRRPVLDAHPRRLAADDQRPAAIAGTADRRLRPRSARSLDADRHHSATSSSPPTRPTTPARQHHRRLHRRSPTRPPLSGKFAYVDRGTCAFAVRSATPRPPAPTGIIVGNSGAGVPLSVIRARPTPLRPRWSAIG